jgi:hypothetical protein
MKQNACCIKISAVFTSNDNDSLDGTIRKTEMKPMK